MFRMMRPQKPTACCHAAMLQAEARSLQMPLRLLAHLRTLLGQAGDPAAPPPEPAQHSVPSVLPEAEGPPASLTWASLDGSPPSPQPQLEPTNVEQRIASSAGASTSGAQQAPGKARRRGRRRPEAAPPEEAAPCLLVDTEEGLAAPVAMPLASANSSSGSSSTDSSSCSSTGTGQAGGGEEAQRLAAAVADIQNRRCPPLGRFGHGNSRALKVTAREKPLPYAIKVSMCTFGPPL